MQHDLFPSHIRQLPPPLPSDIYFKNFPSQLAHSHMITDEERKKDLRRRHIQDIQATSFH